MKEEVSINAAIDLVWLAWTKADRVTKWFAPKAIIEPEMNGSYELYFNPENLEMMNTKGCKIIDLTYEKDLIFSWKGPDHLASIMNIEDLTTVHVRFYKEGNQTKVVVQHVGWKETDEWKPAIEWHQAAWNGVLTSLKSALEKGDGDLCCKPS